jgi:hypothetical protein
MALRASTTEGRAVVHARTHRGAVREGNDDRENEGWRSLAKPFLM